MNHDALPHPRMRPAVLALALVLAGCGWNSNAGANQIVVSAAASLTDAFAELERSYEAAHPGVDVAVNYGGSSALREQILEGAPVDVFASANLSNMEAVSAAGLTMGDPVVFAQNALQIAVPAGNPAEVTGLGDFARDELLLGMCVSAAPCGSLAREALDLAGVTPRIDTTEPDVRALLTRVALGELDAGITYVTDVVSAGDEVEGVEIPPELNLRNEYSIAVMAATAHADIASDFVQFVLSESGRRILTASGFSAP